MPISFDSFITLIRSFVYARIVPTISVASAFAINTALVRRDAEHAVDSVNAHRMPEPNSAMEGVTKSAR
jgi:hypothetical protein